VYDLKADKLSLEKQRSETERNVWAASEDIIITVGGEKIMPKKVLKDESGGGEV